jgi:tetratricopeptide (TPR) repeat protein
MASVFEVQGRYGAALNAEQEASNTMRDLGQQDATSADIQSGDGNALTLIGRSDEAEKVLDGALTVARSVQNDSLVAKILDLQGERLFYRGDRKGARALFDQALQGATRAKDRNLELIAKFDLARLSVRENGGSAAVGTLKGLAKDADATGERYLSAECSLYLGQALVQSKDYAPARQTLESVLRTAQDGGMKSLLPQANYWLAMALRGSGNGPEASSHLQQAHQLLEEMHAESHSDGLLQRDDLQPIVEAFGKLAQK